MVSCGYPRRGFERLARPYLKPMGGYRSGVPPYGYFGMLSFVNVTLIFTFTAFNRYGCWLRKDATFATYGLFGLIGMDWLALLLVVASDVVIGMIVVESMLWKIKKVPISLGVLQ